MNETNGPGAVVPVGWMRTIAGLYPDPSIYTPAVLERGTPILPEEAKEGDLFFWTTSHSAWTVSTCEKSEFITPALERRYEYAWLRPHAVPPQESDKGRGCGQAYHDERGEVQDCEEGALCRRCLERQLAEARAALLAYQEIATEAEHIINASSGGHDWNLGRLNDLVDKLGAAPADVVTVPREEWEALRALFAAAGRAIHAASTGERATLEEINDAWAGVCSAQVALRSSAQGGEGV